MAYRGEKLEFSGKGSVILGGVSHSLVTEGKMTEHTAVNMVYIQWEIVSQGTRNTVSFLRVCGGGGSKGDNRDAILGLAETNENKQKR